MERALLGGAVAEEGQNHLTFVAELSRERDARGLGDALTDDAARAEEPALGVDQVHRAAVAATQPILPAVDLGHDRLGVGAERDRVAVAPIRRHHLVARFHRRQRPDDRRLGAVGEVGVAPDHAGMLFEGPLDALLELADPQHLREHPYEPVVVQLIHLRDSSSGVLRSRRRGTARPSSRMRA